MTTYTYVEAEISDLHKDVHGYRPDAIFWNAWDKMTRDQKQAKWNFLISLL